MIGSFWDKAAFSCAISPISSLDGYGSKKPRFVFAMSDCEKARFTRFFRAFGPICVTVG